MTIYSYTTKLGTNSKKSYTSKEKLMDDLKEFWSEIGAAMLIEDAIKENIITINEIEVE